MLKKKEIREALLGKDVVPYTLLGDASGCRCVFGQLLVSALGSPEALAKAYEQPAHIALLATLNEKFGIEAADTNIDAWIDVELLRAADTFILACGASPLGYPPIKMGEAEVAKFIDLLEHYKH